MANAMATGAGSTAGTAACADNGMGIEPAGTAIAPDGASVKTILVSSLGKRTGMIDSEGTRGGLSCATASESSVANAISAKLKHCNRVAMMSLFFVRRGIWESDS